MVEGCRQVIIIIIIIITVDGRVMMVTQLSFGHPDSRKKSYMQLQAHKEGFVRTVLQMLRAQDAFIQQYLRGELEAPARAAAPRLMQSYFDDPESELRLSPEQRRAADNVDQRVDQALRIREVTDDQELDRLLGLVEEHGSMVAVLGEPGAGKTAVVDRCVRRAQRLGARILIALPTGVQRSRMKQRHPDVDLDTCHGAFLFHRPLVEAMGIMLCYDLIFVDEAAQLFEEHFGRLDEMWRAAGKVRASSSPATTGNSRRRTARSRTLCITPSGGWSTRSSCTRCGGRAPAIRCWTSWPTSARIAPWALRGTRSSGTCAADTRPGPATTSPATSTCRTSWRSARARPRKPARTGNAGPGPDRPTGRGPEMIAFPIKPL